MRTARRRVRRGRGGPAGRGRRVLRRADPAGDERRRGARAAPGGRRADVGQAVLPLRRRRAGSTATPGRRRRRQRPSRGRNSRVAAPRQLRRDLDAGPVGVPLVRRLGPGVPLRGARPGRPAASPRSSSCCCCASGTCTPTGRSRPTSGRSATSTRRCTPGRRCACSRSTAARDHDFLARVFHKLLLNFTWWVNRKDADGQQRLRGRLPRAGQHRPDRPVRGAAGGRRARAERRHRVDGDVRPQPARDGARARRGATPPTRTWRPSSSSTSPTSRRRMRAQGLWDEEDGFFYDVLAFADGSTAAAAGALDGRAAAAVRRHDARRATLARLPEFAARFALVHRAPPAVPRGRRRRARTRRSRRPAAGGGRRRPAACGCSRTMLDEEEFLSPHGLRALSRRHRRAAVLARRSAAPAYTVDYEPGESTSGLFGGNSNWRGPVWFPVNYLLIEALRRYARFFGDDLLVEHPTGSGARLHAGRRSPTTCPGGWSGCSSTTRTAGGRSSAATSCSQTDPRWHDQLLFHEYFHGDTGRGAGRLAPDRLDRAGGRPDPADGMGGHLTLCALSRRSSQATTTRCGAVSAASTIRSAATKACQPPASCPQPQHGGEGRGGGQRSAAGEPPERTGEPAGREVGRVRRVLREQPGDVAHAVPAAEVGAERGERRRDRGGRSEQGQLGRGGPTAAGEPDGDRGARPPARRPPAGPARRRRAAAPSSPARAGPAPARRRPDVPPAAARRWLRRTRPPRGRRCAAGIPTAGRRRPSRRRRSARPKPRRRPRAPAPATRGRPRARPPPAARTRRRRARGGGARGRARSPGTRWSTAPCGRPRAGPRRAAPRPPGPSRRGRAAGRRGRRPRRLRERRPPPGRGGEGRGGVRPGRPAPPAPARRGTKTVTSPRVTACRISHHK